MATKLYADVLPGKFGTLGDSLFTLFQLMTMEGWVDDIVGPVMERQPWAWLFFLPFIVVSTFIVLNLFIGVIVESIQTLRAERESADARAAQAAVDAGRPWRTPTRGRCWARSARCARRWPRCA